MKNELHESFLPESNNQTDNIQSIKKDALNRSKAITAIAIFAAIAIVLHISPLKMRTICSFFNI